MSIDVLSPRVRMVVPAVSTSTAPTCACHQPGICEMHSFTTTTAPVVQGIFAVNDATVPFFNLAGVNIANPTSLGRVWVGMTRPTPEALEAFLKIGKDNP